MKGRWEAGRLERQDARTPRIREVRKQERGAELPAHIVALKCREKKEMGTEVHTSTSSPASKRPSVQASQLYESSSRTAKKALTTSGSNWEPEFSRR